MDLVHWRASRAVALCAVVGVLTGCGSVGGALFGSESEVGNTATYNQAKVFYIDPQSDGNSIRRFSDLKEPWADKTTTKAVKNSDPVTIVANKAYIPFSITSAAKRGVADIIGNRWTRDITVLLDVGLRQGVDEEFIAIWYQRDVPADSVLDFSNLPLFSIDAWNSDVPPYFRMQIVDVRAERNTKTAGLLKQVNSVGSAAVSLAGTPAAGLFFSAGVAAAKLILANDRNRTLLDFTFNLYAPSQVNEAGGMPLGLFKKGGMVLLGMPRGAPDDYWDKAFEYDFQRERVRVKEKSDTADTADTPFLMTTVLTAETMVPNIVKRRSAAIVKILTNPEATVQEDLSGTLEDAKALLQALEVLKARQDFRKFPTTSALQTLIGKANARGDDLKAAEKDFLLATLRNATGVSFSRFRDYADWYAKCKTNYELEDDQKKLSLKTGAVPCDFTPTP
ncbi:MAG: hypothetical protein FD153_478 [Rhodospirillaceae bacterium]|nr:MAG: hypothetical protein FD153_478 [Rhodospirillaceae bacterium]